MADRPIRIAALISQPRVGWTDAWGPMDVALRHFDIPVWRAGGAWWHHSMDTLFVRAVDLELDWILTLDYDSVFTAAHLEKMFGIMHKRPDIDALAPMQVNVYGKVLAGKKDQAGGRVESDGLPIRVDMAHFGCTIIRVQALRTTPVPWFEEKCDDEGHFTGETRIDADAAFWKKFRDAGHRIYLAPEVKIGHLQVFVRSLMDDGMYDLSTVAAWLQRQVKELQSASQDSATVRQP